MIWTLTLAPRGASFQPLSRQNHLYVPKDFSKQLSVRKTGGRSGPIVLTGKQSAGPTRRTLRQTSSTKSGKDLATEINERAKVLSSAVRVMTNVSIGRVSAIMTQRQAARAALSSGANTRAASWAATGR